MSLHQPLPLLQTENFSDHFKRQVTIASVLVFQFIHLGADDSQQDELHGALFVWSNYIGSLQLSLGVLPIAKLVVAQH